MIRKTTILKTIVITRRKAPRLVRKIAKSVAMSSAAEVLLHHKPPDGTVVIDITVIETVDACVKILSHHL